MILEEQRTASIRSPGGSPSLLRLVPLGLGISVVPLDTAVNIAFHLAVGLDLAVRMPAHGYTVRNA